MFVAGSSQITSNKETEIFETNSSVISTKKTLNSILYTEYNFITLFLDEWEVHSYAIIPSPKNHFKRNTIPRCPTTRIIHVVL